MVNADDRIGGGVGQVRDVAFDPGQGACLVDQVLVEFSGAASHLDEPFRLIAVLPSMAFCALPTCSSIPRSVRRVRSARYW